MLITINGDVTNVGEFYSMYIRHTPTTKQVPNDEEGWFKPAEKTVRVDRWTLFFKYSPPGRKEVITNELWSDKRKLLEDEAKEIIKQVRVLAPDIITQAFEEAFFGEGK